MHCLASLFVPPALLALVLVSAPPSRSRAQPPAPASATAVTRGSRDFLQHLCWSPDGTKFLVTRIHAGKMGLWTVSADGKEWKCLLGLKEQPHFDGHWSPDGKQI